MKRLMSKSRNNLRLVRHARVRARMHGTAEKPRLSVFRGLKGMVAQIIDDNTGKTLCAAKSAETKGGKAEGRTGKVAEAYLVGQKLAEKATALKISTVVFDRGGYAYHGRVAALADGARAGGLKF
ncbi:MAG: 50S ribosomal protein L18 [bacterium]|nr:50S ribosomal protein L18 [bacterium]